MASCRLEKDVVSNTHTHTAHKKRNTKKNSKRKSEESREWCQSGREKEEEEVEEKERHTTLTTGCSYDTEESKKKKRKRQDKNNNHHNNKRTERILSSGQAIQRDRVIVVHRSIKERWFIGQKWSPLRLNNKSEKRCWLVVNMFLSLCVCLPVCRVYKKLIKELGGILEKGEIFFSRLMVARWWQHLFGGDVKNQLALLSLRVSTTGYTRKSNLLITYSTVKWFSHHRRASSKQLSLTLWSNNSKLKEDIIRSLATAAWATEQQHRKRKKN